jgi:hypothetical protein
MSRQRLATECRVVAALEAGLACREAGTGLVGGGCDVRRV